MSITEGQLTRRGKVWHWRYRLDGVQRSRSLKTTDYREARSIRQVLIAEYLERPEKFSHGNANPTVDAFAADYFAWAETNLRKSTVSMKRVHWGNLIDYTRARRLGDVTASRMEDFKTFMVSVGPRGTPLAKVSANIALRNIRSMFAFAIEKNWFTGENPAKLVRQFKVTERQRSRADYLTTAELDALVQAAEAHSRNMHGFVLLCAYAGLRLLEAVNVRWEWLDFERGVISIKEHEGFELKDAAERTVPMHRKIKAALRAYAKPEGFLFESGRASKGIYRYRWEPRKALAVVKAASGIERHVTAQILRITFGSLAVQSGISIYKVAEWLGHSDVKTTRKHYAGLAAADDEINKI